MSVEPAAGSNPWLRLSETIWAGGHPPGRYPLLSRTLVSSPTQLNYSHFSWEGAHVQKSKIPLADLAKVCVDATMHRAGHPERYIENVQYRNVAACLWPTEGDDWDEKKRFHFLKQFAQTPQQMHTYTCLSSANLSPTSAYCCFMWLQLYSFQNILGNQFLQRPQPQGEEGGGHVCLLCPWRALWVYVS